MQYSFRKMSNDTGYLRIVKMLLKILNPFKVLVIKRKQFDYKHCSLLEVLHWNTMDRDILAENVLCSVCPASFDSIEMFVFVN